MKFEMDEHERSAFAKLPVRLRARLAVLINEPDLGGDKRGKHWVAKRKAQDAKASERVYVVTTFGAKPKPATLEEAAALADLDPEELRRQLERSYSREAEFTVAGLPVTVRGPPRSTAVR